MKYNKIFTCIFLAIFTLISLMILIYPDQIISETEKRKLVGFNDLKETSYFDNTFQETIESALMDQFFLRYELVDLKSYLDYQITDIAFMNYRTLLRSLSNSGVMQVGNTQQMIDKPIEYVDNTFERIKQRALEMNDFQERNPDIKVVTYLPISPSETAIFDEENQIHSYGDRYVAEISSNITILFDSFEIETIEDVSVYFQKTDHHLNNVGLHKMYSEIMNLIGNKNDVKVPVNETCSLPGSYYGAFSSRTGYVLEGDDFCKYEYELSPYKVYLKDSEIDKNGQNTFLEDIEDIDLEERPYYYVIAYDEYESLVELDFQQEDKPNVLLVGDSLSNGILEVFASSFNKTYRLIPYDYTKEEGKLFDYDEFVEENEIDIVIFAYGLVNYSYVDEWGDRFLETTIQDFNE